MQIRKKQSRLRKFQERYLSGKAAVLFIVNRKMASLLGADNNFGKLVDLTRSRSERTITMKTENHEGINSITLRGYNLVHRRGEPFLVWRSIDFAGPAADNYRSIFAAKDGLRLSKKFFNLVEAVL